jgi:hypothetical protein
MARRKGKRPSYKCPNLRRAIKAFLVLPASSQCQTCGYKAWPGNLTFHHKEPSAKKFNISAQLFEMTLAQLVREASKCVLMCHNCHGEVHAGLRNVEDVPLLDYSEFKIPPDVLKWYKARAPRSKPQVDSVEGESDDETSPPAPKPRKPKTRKRRKRTVGRTKRSGS